MKAFRAFAELRQHAGPPDAPLLMFSNGNTLTRKKFDWSPGLLENLIDAFKVGPHSFRMGATSSAALVGKNEENNKIRAFEIVMFC